MTSGAARSGSDLWPMLALGALAGLRSMLPLALVSRRLAARRPRPAGLRALLGSRPVPVGLALAAAGELVADKTALVPARTQPLPLAGRLLAGAVVAAAARGPATSAAGAALAGALGALAGSFGGYHLRRAGGRLLDRDWPAAVAEDALCLLATRALLGRRS
jgi:uncharacterized membrane protein